jgi:hypothetical protein
MNKLSDYRNLFNRNLFDTFDAHGICDMDHLIYFERARIRYDSLDTKLRSLRTSMIRSLSYFQQHHFRYRHPLLGFENKEALLRRLNEYSHDAFCRATNLYDKATLKTTMRLSQYQYFDARHEFTSFVKLFEEEGL